MPSALKNSEASVRRVGGMTWGGLMSAPQAMSASTSALNSTVPFATRVIKYSPFSIVRRVPFGDVACKGVRRTISPSTGETMTEKQPSNPCTLQMPMSRASSRW